MPLVGNLLNFLKATILSKNIFFLAAGIIGVGLIIAFHEFGHFIFCKIFNIRVPSFSIGMGPRVLTKRIGGTDFSLSALPLGGYVEIANIPEEGVLSPEESSQYFTNKPYWQKVAVMSGGILFNLIFAYVIFSLLYLFGMPDTPIIYPENAQPVIREIMKDSPAEKAGLQLNDKITAINSQPLDNSYEKLSNLIRPLANQEITVAVERNGQLITQTLIVGEQKIGGESRGYLGARFMTTELPRLPFFEAIKRGIKRTNMIFWQTFQIFKWMFTERHIEGLGGPIMIFSQTMEHAERGIKIFFAFLALISINLAILNLIPLPILDGGQILFATIEAIIRRPLPMKIKEYIQIITWVGFLALALYLSYKDIKILRFLRSAKDEQQEVKK